MSHFIVTGAAGFIGSHVAEALLARGDRVSAIDDFNDFYEPRLKEENAALLARHARFRLVRGSILDPDALNAVFAAKDGERIDAVIHLAAWAGVRPSIARPGHYQKQNVEGTVAVLDAARAQAKPPRVVFASSSSVYGDSDRVPFHEDDRVDFPVSPYAATKKAGELMAYAYHHLYGLDVACLRFFTVYGPRQRPEMAIHKFARLLVEGQPVPCFGDGSTARDYTFVDDTVQGVVASADRARGFHIYNLGNSRTVRLDELIEMLARALDVKAHIARLPEQPGDVRITYANIDRAKSELGYAPAYPFERGLERFAEWFLARRRALGAS